ncbi:unnamed protein product [Mucor hiemalis]
MSFFITCHLWLLIFSCRLKFKNQSLLSELQQRMVSFSEMNSDDTITYDSHSEKIYQRNVNDSLTRMNLSLEKLIEEAEASLSTRLSLHADPHLLRRSRSCPKFTTKRNEFKRRNSSSSSFSLEEDGNNAHESERQLKAQQQKRRYFHSQWKLAIAMKSLVQTVQKSTIHETKAVEPQTLDKNVVVHHHIHHHYHHVYHHYNDNIKEIEVPLKEIKPEASDLMECKLTVVPNKSQEVPLNSVGASMMRRDSSSLSSLFKYALHTAAGMISEPRSPKASVKNITKHIPRPVKIRTIFVATVLILQKYNKTAVWTNRGNFLLSRWSQISKQQCDLWIRHSHLLHLVIQLVALHKK